ncbi:Adenylate cyclase [Labilithrix luteola]|uniref:Adenylate cyclase n=1 Tax=Labilithrix luteola TaxID=1391654 RepID=A0A0K1QCY4_9BACT|nr:tetratricopeptide repeat protein [Labilithrix luteola]AKV03275.1 Adenylate cyclase [Labilithrix luteola]
MAESVSFAPAGFGTIDRRAVLVGRAVEMRVLDAAMRAVREDGRSRTVTLVGAAGIGKTRLVRDFLGKQRGTSVDVRASQGPESGIRTGAPRVFRGSAREGGGAYDVFARVLRARFGIVEGMDAEAAKAQVRSQVAAVLEDRKVGDVCYFLGQLLELEFLDSPLIEAVRSDPQQMRFLRRAVIKRFLEADALHAPPTRDTAPDPLERTGEFGSIYSVRTGRGPIVLVFDDLQYAHEESLELLAFLVESLQAPILMLCVARPEMIARRDEWAKHGAGSFGRDAQSRSSRRHEVIELSPLSETDAAAVMQDLLAPCGESEGVDELVDAACTLAGGNPALLERMVHIFLDMGVIEAKDDFAEVESWTVHVDKLSAVKLPLTVEDAIQARISALAPHERDLLERAATMGSVFWLGGLLAIARLDVNAPDVWSQKTAVDVAKIHETLKELKERDYILTLPDSTFADDEEYAFKHNLERETLLKLQPKGQSKRFHKAIADWLSFKPNVRSHEEYIGQLARHQERAGLVVQAAATYLDAADLARERYANTKASEYYVKGLGLLRDGAEGSTEQQLRALHHYGDVLQVLGKSDEALDAFNEMLARAYRLNLKSKGGAAHSRIGRLYRDTGRLEDAKIHLEAALALFEESNDERGIASTIDDLGKLYWLRGDYPRALESTQRALVMRRKFGDRRSIALSLNNLGLVYQDSGQFKLALDAFEQALRIRREIGDLVGVSISLNNLGTVAQDQRDDRQALTLFLEAYEVAKETGDRNRLALILTNLGETSNRLGDPAKAIQHLKQAEEIADELGDKLGLAEAVRGLGKAYLAQREYTKARECTQRAVDIFREIQSKVQLGVALRSLGEVMASGSAGGEGLLTGRAHLLQSIWIFEEIGNDVELARSCRVYANLLRASLAMENDPTTAAEADQFARRAEEIFARLKISAYGLDADVFFGTR